MNREIKFRAYVKYEGELCRGLLITEGGTVHNVVAIDWNKGNVEIEDYSHYEDRSSDTLIEFPTSIIPLDECELIQYTGLKDKNGKEIFEGDIVKYNEWDKETINVVEDLVEFLKDCGFKEDELGIDLYNCFEVIGNIWENPELLGGK